MTDTYCKLFISSELPHETLSNIIAEAVSGCQVRIWSISSPALDIYINLNDEYDANKTCGEEDGFLYFKFFLDIEPTPGTDIQRYIKAIAHLMQALHQNGMQSVAACDFEDRLPKYW